MTSRCEVVIGDRLKGTVRLEKGKIKQTVNNSHRHLEARIVSQRDNEEGTLRHGLKTNLKRSTRWVVGVRKVWGTRESESGNEVATEMVMAVGKMASGLILDNEASGSAEC